MSIIKQVKKFKKRKFNYFTTPSHSQKSLFKSILGDKYFSADFSEVDGLDNIYEEKGAFKDFLEWLRETYKSQITLPLTNGSTQGILAAMLATLKDGDRVLVARNCHKSVHNGLILTGAAPIWLMPAYDKDFGIYKSISPIEIETILKQNPSIKTVIISNPTYDGAISNIEKISTICKEHNAVLIVDEAHGALWNFDRSLGTPAILAGADISIQSLHKTAGAVSPCALLHISQACPIASEKIKEALSLVSTTSAPLPILLNIEETTNYLNSKKGKKEIDKLIENIYFLHQKSLNFPNIEVLNSSNDPTKIVIRFKNISAFEACDILYDKFKIECEICRPQSLTFLTGVGTTAKKIKTLIKGLQYINKIAPSDDIDKVEAGMPGLAKIATTPKIAYQQPFETVLAQESVGKICAEFILDYPPGIPFLTYGEVISEEHLELISSREEIRIVKQ